MKDVLQSGYYRSPSGYENVDWSVYEMIKSDNIMNFYFKNIKKDIVVTLQDEKHFRITNICWFCERLNYCNKFRDHCHLTVEYRGTAHEKRNINVKRKQSNFIPTAFHNFSKYDCHQFKTLVNKKDDKVKSDIIPKTNEKHISVTYVCIRFTDSYRFLSDSLDKVTNSFIEIKHKSLKTFKEQFPENFNILTETEEIEFLMSNEKYENESIEKSRKEFPEKKGKLKHIINEDSSENTPLKIMRNEFIGKWRILCKKLAYPWEYFKKIEDYKVPVNKL